MKKLFALCALCTLLSSAVCATESKAVKSLPQGGMSAEMKAKIDAKMKEIKAKVDAKKAEFDKRVKELDAKTKAALTSLYELFQLQSPQGPQDQPQK